MSDESTAPDARALLWGAREALLGTRAWMDYVRGVYSVDPGDYPFLTYVGLNFTDRTIKNFKFYFSFYRRLSAEEIAVLLPVPDRGRFDELYARWHPSRSYGAMHRGTTFAVKVDAQGALTHYYHMRLPDMPMGPPLRLALHPGDVGNYHGVCEEFSGAQTSLKRYYYCGEPDTIRDALVQVGLQDGLDQVPQIPLLEYIESEQRDKLTFITGSRNLMDSLVLKRGPPRLDFGLAKLCRDCDFELFGPGSARDLGDHSVYFIQPAGTPAAAGNLFDGVRRFVARYLKLPDL